MNTIATMLCDKLHALQDDIRIRINTEAMTTFSPSSIRKWQEHAPQEGA
jgi:hypothetical protein